MGQGLILGIDTTGRQGSAALATAAEGVELRKWRAEPSHTPHLHTAVEELLGIAGPRLEAVAVAVGPGGFSAVRSGLAIAKGLCLALDITLVPVSSLEAVALSAGSPEGGRFVALIEAGAQGYFAQEFTVDGDGARPTGEAALATTADVIASIAQGARPVGDLAKARADEIEALAPGEVESKKIRKPRPVATAVALAGWSKLGAATGRDGLGAIPTYLREPDATLPKRGWGRT